MKILRVIAVCACIVLISAFFLPLFENVGIEKDLIKWEYFFIAFEEETPNTSLFNMTYLLFMMITPDKVGVIDVAGVPVGGYSTFSGASAICALFLGLLAALVIIPLLNVVFILRKKHIVSFIFSMLNGGLLYLLSFHIFDISMLSHGIAYYGYLIGFAVLIVCSFSLLIGRITHKD